MARIFISHAKADEVLIDAFVDLLHVGLNLKQEDIFCTSLEGTGIPRGSNFVEFIKKTFKDSDFVIMVITAAYYESVFCLCELGATWIMGSDAMPFLVPPLEYDDLKAVLVGVQAGCINDKRALNELRDRLLASKIASGATDKWESKRDTFLKKFSKLQAKLKGRSSIPAADFDKLKATYEEAQNTLLERDDTIDKLEERIRVLEKLKDREQVKEVRKRYTNEQQQFDELTSAFKKVSQKLPSKAIEALYYDHKGVDWAPPRFGNEHVWEDIEAAEQRGFVRIDGNAVSVDDSNPVIRAAQDALSELSSFMVSASQEFIEAFEEEREYQFSLSNRGFWENYLDL